VNHIWDGADVTWRSYIGGLEYLEQHALQLSQTTCQTIKAHLCKSCKAEFFSGEVVDPGGSSVSISKIILTNVGFSALEGDKIEEGWLQPIQASSGTSLQNLARGAAVPRRPPFAPSAKFFQL